mgnify:CR=1 FL=1
MRSKALDCLIRFGPDFGARKCQVFHHMNVFFQNTPNAFKSSLMPLNRLNLIKIQK